MFFFSAKASTKKVSLEILEAPAAKPCGLVAGLVLTCVVFILIVIDVVAMILKNDFTGSFKLKASSLSS